MTTLTSVPSLEGLLAVEAPVVHVTARAVSDLIHLAPVRQAWSSAAVAVFDGRPLMATRDKQEGGENYPLLGRFWSHA